MKEFLTYYYFNLWRSKEKSIPYGFMAMGSMGILLYKNFPFDLFVFCLSTIFVQWFCFGLSAEILVNFEYSINGLFLPTLGLIISLFVFDFIHFNKSLFFNLKYLWLLDYSKNEVCQLKSLNEYLGGKAIAFFVFMAFSLYYCEFSIKIVFLDISIFLLYNSIILLLANILIKYKNLFTVLFFVSQFSLLFIFDGEQSGFQQIVLAKEVWFNDFLSSSLVYLLLAAMVSVIIQFIVNFKIYR
jgi:hypothetical protein